MPKDEFDFEDPFELNGMAFLTHEDTTNDMARTFIEEFLRMGYGPERILALFRDRHYLGPNRAYEKQGEPFIRELITEAFARWGRAVTWAGAGAAAPAQPADPLYRRPPVGNAPECAATVEKPSAGGLEIRDSAGGKTSGTTRDNPTGAPLPEKLL